MGVQTSRSSENMPQRQSKCPFQNFGSCAQSLQCHVGLGDFVSFFLPTGLPVERFQLSFPLPWTKLGKHKLPLKRDKYRPTIYPYTPALLFLFPTDSKNETIHSRPKSDVLAEIKHQFSKGF